MYTQKKRNEYFTEDEIEKLTALYELTGNRELIDLWKGKLNADTMAEAARKGSTASRTSAKFCPAHVLHYGELDLRL